MTASPTLSPGRLDELLAEFRRRHVVVLGDLMLDEFIWGKVSRISPEAPVPVVEVERESYYPGGSANVARNLCEFCPRVEVVGLIGEDAPAERLRALLKSQSIGLEGVLSDSARRTIVKTRIIARHQQVVRVDRESKLPPTSDQTNRILAYLDQILPGTDAVILEDYGKGFFQKDVVERVVELVHRHGKIATADINPGNPVDWRGVDAVKPNRSEAFRALGLPVADPVDPVLDDRALLDVAARLQEKWETPTLLITLGEQGMLLFQRGKAPFHTPTRAREVYDVSGAGDTAIALFTLALCSGASPEEAAEISNHASGVAVGKLGTATVTPEELRLSFHSG